MTFSILTTAYSTQIQPFVSHTTTIPQSSHHNHDQDTSSIRPLQFIEFANNSANFLALIDGGSQLNLVSHCLLPFLKFTHAPQPTLQLRGVGGSPLAISQFIFLPISLQNGYNGIIHCGVITDLPCVAIFGLPFLYQTQAAHTPHQSLLSTPQGPIPLTIVKNLRELQTCITTVGFTHDLEIDLSHTLLNSEERQQLLDLLKEYDDLWRGGIQGKAVNVAHRIQLTTNQPIVSRPRQTTEAQQKIIQKEIDKMLNEGVIQPSNSSYASEVTMVLKKAGEWRFCVDYRELNKITVKDRYPLPRISELIRLISTSKYFISLDLRAGYWQIPMDKDSIKYTAFRCFMGLYEFLVMPFGLTNALASFQRIIDFLFGDLRFKGVTAYLDDLLIHKPTFQEALNFLKIVFTRLRAAELKLNLEKCTFFPKSLRYLGQIIENGKLIPDKDRINVLRKFKTPQTIHDVRQLLGLLGVYQRFICGYATILYPVFDLLRVQKNTKQFNLKTLIKWIPAHQAAINKAIDQLESAVLCLPLDAEEFLLETDASNTALGAILNIRYENEWKPVEFYSKTFSKTEQNWPVREREAYAIIAALRKFDSYIRGKKIRVHTDHESLKWMLEANKAKIARWVSCLAKYNLEVFYKRGSELTHAGFLSRSIDHDPCPFLQDRMTYFTAITPLPSLQEIIEEQGNSLAPVGKGFASKDGVIYYHGLVWGPPRLQIEIIAACHSVAPFHHPGIKKTQKTINRIFNWPNIHKDVAQYLQSCIYCKRSRSGKERLQGFFRSHPLPGAFETVYMDFWQCHYNGVPHTVLTLIDQLTKWAECIPLKDKEANTVARALLKAWIYKFGAPRVLMSDNESSFIGGVLTHVSKQLGITRLTATVYHPEGQATIESFHRNLSRGLRHVNQIAVPFDEALEMILLAYRATIHTTTQDSPAYLTLGIDPRLAPDGDWRMEPSVLDEERLQFLAKLRLDVQLRAQNALNRQNMNKNEKRSPVIFQEGQLVLVRAIPLQQLMYKTAFYKAVPRWSLPHRVTKVIADGKKAIVRCLLTQNSREIHISDAQFISPPCGRTQKEEWIDVVRAEAESMFDTITCQRKINEFFKVLEFPQESLTLIENRKRCRKT